MREHFFQLPKRSEKKRQTTRRADNCCFAIGSSTGGQCDRGAGYTPALQPNKEASYRLSWSRSPYPTRSPAHCTSPREYSQINHPSDTLAEMFIQTACQAKHDNNEHPAYTPHPRCKTTPFRFQPNLGVYRSPAAALRSVTSAPTEYRYRLCMLARALPPLESTRAARGPRF